MREGLGGSAGQGNGAGGGGLADWGKGFGLFPGAVKADEGCNRSVTGFDFLLSSSLWLPCKRDWRGPMWTRGASEEAARVTSQRDD